MQLPSVMLWGDSIGRGIDFDSVRGRYAVLRENFERVLRRRGVIDIDNRARFGATVTDGLKDYMEADAGEGIVLLEYGGNDCNMPWADVSENPGTLHAAATPLELFEDTLTRFARLVKERGGRPLLVTPPPLIAERFVPWVSQGLNASAILRYLGDVQHVYRWHERYANAVKRVANTLRCGLVDLRDRLLAEPDYPSLVGVDGMHINERGHAVIADALEQLLPEALRADTMPRQK